MASNRPMITGELRKWRRHKKNGFGAEHADTPSVVGITGYVYNSDIWDDGEEASLVGYPSDHGGFYLLTCGMQVYRLPKDEEVK